MTIIIMSRKIFPFIAVIVLLLSTLAPVVNTTATEEKKQEIVIRIYTLYGVEKVAKKLPTKDIIKLKEMAYKTKECIATLSKENISIIEKMRAEESINLFLYEMKRNGLLGNLTIEEAKNLITGKYISKKSLEIKRRLSMVNFLDDLELEWNMMCGMIGWGYVVDTCIWNLPLQILGYLGGFLTFWTGIFAIFGFIIQAIAVLSWFIIDAIPHPTTIVFWRMGNIYTLGLEGEKKSNESMYVIAITIGFTGIVILPFIAIGFCPFVAFSP